MTLQKNDRGFFQVYVKNCRHQWKPEAIFDTEADAISCAAGITACGNHGGVRRMIQGEPDGMIVEVTAAGRL
jgi:hypothetical protein